MPMLAAQAMLSRTGRTRLIRRERQRQIIAKV
jgi:hypothetical protein